MTTLNSSSVSVHRSLAAGDVGPWAANTRASPIVKWRSNCFDWKREKIIDGWTSWGFHHPFNKIPGPGCSKLTTSLVNVLLKFQMLKSEIRHYFLLKKCEKLCTAKASLIFSTTYMWQIWQVWPVDFKILTSRFGLKPVDFFRHCRSTYQLDWCVPEQWYWDTFYWIFVIFTEIFENGSLIYRTGRAANRLYKQYFSATGGRIICMKQKISVYLVIKSWNT